MTVRTIHGDCRDVLPTMEAESFDCIVTSPPYWRQRDYGVDGQIGLEPTPEEYIAKLVSIFREGRRSLKPQGTAWINIGDKWASGGNGGGGSFMKDRGDAWAHAKGAKGWRSPPSGYKDKDLVGLPFMLAFAMRADGWFWRQCNIWAKPNGMPESVRDRSTASHEYVLHFSKSNNYFYDFAAARTPAAPSSETRLTFEEARNPDTSKLSGAARKGSVRADGKQRGHSRRHDGFNGRWDAMSKDERQANGANLRSVWWISPAQFRDGHYAVMPNALAEICITAGCPRGGHVLDPFGGAGTTGLVADRLGRSATLIELNPAYRDMGENRIRDDAPLFWQAPTCGAE